MPFTWNTVLPGDFYRRFLNKDTHLQMEGVLMMFLELEKSVGVELGGV